MGCHMNKAPYLIGVAGTSGSGKTLFLQYLLRQFAPGSITLISLDDYYRPVDCKTGEENMLHNFDVPEAFDLETFHAHILRLTEGKTVVKQEYTFNNPALKPRMLTLKPAPVLVIEGLFIFHDPVVSKQLQLRIFIHADDKVALQRRIRRDAAERGYDEQEVRYKWNNHVQPAYRKYLLPYKNQSNIIIENSTDEPEKLKAIAGEIAASLPVQLLPGR